MEKERKNNEMIPLNNDNSYSKELIKEAEKYIADGNEFYAERYYLKALRASNGISLEVPCKCFKELFQISIHKKSYGSASTYLEQYIKSLNMLNIPNDTSILTAIFNKVSLGKTTKIDNIEYYMEYKIEDKQLKDFFLILIRLCNKDNYEKALNIIDSRMEEYSKKYPQIDFSILRILFNELLEIKYVKVKSLSNYYMEVLKLAIANHDGEKVINTVNVIIKNPYIEESVIYNVLYTLIKNNYYHIVASLLDSITITDQNKDMVTALKNAIVNQEFYLNMSDDMRSDYQETIALGKQYFRDGEYDKSLESYAQGRKMTKGNIFDYYLGKIMFHLGRFDEAEHYFNNYIKNGSDKLSKTYRYLAVIAEKKHDSELSAKYLNQSQKYIILYDQYKCLDTLSNNGVSLEKKQEKIS